MKAATNIAFAIVISTGMVCVSFGRKWTNVENLMLASSFIWIAIVIVSFFLEIRKNNRSDQ